MKIYEFEKYFPTEEACMAKFREYRERQGVVCPHCGCTRHYWVNHRGGMFQCAECRYRQSLKANTILHGSKLPFKVWFLAMHLLTSTKHSFSAAELMRQLGFKRYQPVWELLHKIREAMGKRDNEYILEGNVEVDEGFFSTEIPLEQKSEPLRQGAGSQAKTKVLVMAESKPVETSKKRRIPKLVGHIKMVVVPDLKADTIDPIAVAKIAKESDIVSDATSSHRNFPHLFHSYDGRVIKPEDIGKVLPWVHIAISNAKTLLADIYHGVKRELLQGYLNEFCYKFNRRSFGEKMFERLVLVCASYKNSFMHRTYTTAVVC